MLSMRVKNNMTNIWAKHKKIIIFFPKSKPKQAWIVNENAAMNISCLGPLNSCLENKWNLKRTSYQRWVRTCVQSAEQQRYICYRLKMSGRAIEGGGWGQRRRVRAWAVLLRMSPAGSCWIFGAPAAQAWIIAILKGEAHEINIKWFESLAPLLPGLKNCHFKGRGSRNKYEMSWLAPLLPRPEKQSL